MPYVVLCCLLLPQAAPPTLQDDLLRFVPDDAAFVLLANHLDSRLAELVSSPFGQALGKSALASRLQHTKEWQEMLKFQQYIYKHLELTPADLAEVFPGERLALVYRPGPANNPEQDQGLIVLRTRKPEALRKLIDRLNDAQKKAGELRELQTVEHRGRTYIRRLERADTNFYYLEGSLLLFTGQEVILQDALNSHLDRKKDDLGRFGTLRASLRERAATIRLLLNARALDATFAAQARREPASKSIYEYWKGLDGLELSLSWQVDFTLRLHLLGDPKKLPCAGQRFFAAPVRMSEVWSRMPEQPLLAMGNPVDLVGLYGVLGDFIPPELRQRSERELESNLGVLIGRGIIKEVLPVLGPDWGLYAVAPPSDSRELFPRAVFAVRLQPQPGDDLDETLLEGVHAWAQLAILAHNKLHPDQPARSRPRTIDKTRVRVVEGLPYHLLPAYALRDGYLVVTSHADEIARFKANKRTTPTELPLLRLSFTGLREHVSQRRDRWIDWLSRRDGLSREMASQRIDEWLGGLQLLHSLELVQEAATSRVTFTLRLTPAQALTRVKTHR
ncbi:MAG: hypothetical protein SNJ82_07830 [Gemmataceae bacterium]